MVHWHKQALKHMAKLSTSRREQIREAVDGLPDTGDIKKLQGQQYAYRLRIVGYRVIYRFINGDIYIH
ncbi:MAG: type II toxin-antitoxin system RelE/ParE family toxin [Clostridiales bacterium]|nr:type II toxin-antitoxin system RelE/ParE family toxin [Clostridiales bacterium]